MEYVIKQKMSGTGTIHDIASETHDRVIKFGKDCKYAVVWAAYYGGKGYTTHRTEEAAVKASKKYKGLSYQIIDINGNCYAIQQGYWHNYLRPLD